MTGKRIVLAIVSIIVISSVATSQFSLAQEAIPQETLPAVAIIESRCASITADLRQLHTSDSLTRVNAGQAYGRVSLRLMARLNSRLALNRIDSANLVKLSSEFDGAREKFVLDFDAYESALSSLIKIDCRKKPIDFYVQLNNTRELRQKVLATTKLLNQLMSSYGSEVEQLRNSYEIGQK